MIDTFYATGFAKEVCYATLTLSVYIMVGISRHYYTFLFYQLDLSESNIILDANQKSWIASSIGFLCPLGCLISGTIMDICGRKLYLFLMFLPFVASWTIFIFAKNYETLLIGATVQGLGGGMSLCVSTYISEITTSHHRGAILGLTQVSYSLGAFLCYLLMYNLQWKVAAFVFAISAFLCLILTLLLLPESPVWLYAKGREKEAINKLRRIRGGGGGGGRGHLQTLQSLQPEITQIRKFCQHTNKSTLWVALKRCLTAWKPLAIIVIMANLLQHTGFSAFVAYTILIVDQLNVPFNAPKVAVAFSAAGFVGSVLTPAFMHFFGRRTLLAAATLGMGLCCALIAIYEEIFYFDVEKAAAWLVPGAVCAYAAICNIGARPVCLIIGGEVFPQEVSGTMNGIYGVIAYCYWVLVIKMFPFFLAATGVKATVWTLTGSCFAVAAYAILFVPETKGKSLNEVQEQYFREKGKQIVDEVA